MILYKYLPPARIDVLQTCFIRYSQPKALNDVFEASISITKVAENSTAEDMFEKLLPEILRKVYYDEFVCALDTS